MLEIVLNVFGSKLTKREVQKLIASDGSVVLVGASNAIITGDAKGATYVFNI